MRRQLGGGLSQQFSGGCNSGLGAEAVAQACSHPPGGGEEGVGAERTLSLSMCLGLQHEGWTCQKELLAENWQRACEFPPDKSPATGEGAGWTDSSGLVHVHAKGRSQARPYLS